MNPSAIRVALIGVNTWHAEAFRDVILGTGPAEELGPLPGVEVVAVWGEPSADRHSYAKAFGCPEAIGDVSELVDHIDLALVIDDEGGGARHRALAEPFIRAGTATFIDKPMALTLADARAMFALAEDSGAALLSTSALRFSAELAENRPALASLAPIRSLHAHGPGEWYYYGIHAAELLLAVADGSPSFVSRFVTETQDVAVIGLVDGRLVSMETVRDAYYTFTLNAYGEHGWLNLEVTRNYEFYRNMLQAAVDMARSGISPVSAKETMAVLAVLQAGVLSGRLGRVVSIDELADLR